MPSAALSPASPTATVTVFSSPKRVAPVTVAVTVTVVALLSSPSATASGLTERATAVGLASLSVIVPVAVFCVAWRAAWSGSPRVTVTVSLPSWRRSPLTGTVIVALPWPAMIVTEPEAVPV